MTRLLVFILLFFGIIESKAKVPRIKLQLNASIVDGGIIYSAGDRGFYLTTDNALSKYEMSSVSKAMMNDIFVNGSHIVVAGHYSQVLYKEKSGEKFSPIKLDLESDESFFNITNGEKELLISGSYGSVVILDKNFKSKFIRVIIDEELEPHIYDAVHVSSSKYILAGEKGLVLDFDSASGKVSKLASPVESSLFGIDIHEIGGQQYLFIYGLLGNIYYAKFQDGSKAFSWKKISTPSKSHINKVVSLNDGKLLMGGNSGQIYMYDMVKDELSSYRHPKGLGILDIDTNQGQIYFTTSLGLEAYKLEEMVKWRSKKK